MRVCMYMRVCIYTRAYTCMQAYACVHVLRTCLESQPPPPHPFMHTHTPTSIYPPTQPPTTITGKARTRSSKTLAVSNGDSTKPPPPPAPHVLSLVGRQTFKSATETFKSGNRTVSDKRILQHITASSCMRGLNLSFRACQRDYGRGRGRERGAEGEGGEKGKGCVCVFMSYISSNRVCICEVYELHVIQ